LKRLKALSAGKDLGTLRTSSAFWYASYAELVLSVPRKDDNDEIVVIEGGSGANL